MKLNKLRQFAQVALFSLMACSVGTSFAQVSPGGAGLGTMSPIAGPDGTVPCPHPFTRTLTASGNFVHVPDMPAGWNGHAHQGIGGAAVNTWSGYSFDLGKPPLPDKCCEITSAKLTVTFKALQAGQIGPSSATSGNDLWNIVSGGNTVTAGVNPLPTPYIFGTAGSVALGQQITKTVTVTNYAVLHSGYLSIFVEDDTDIVSATLVLSGCCVNIPPR